MNHTVYSFAIPESFMNDQVKELFSAYCPVISDNVCYSGVYYLADFEMNSDNVEDITTKLKSLRVPFDMSNPHDWGYDGTSYYYRPMENGEEKEFTVKENVKGYQYITIDKLIPLIAMSSKDCRDGLEELINQMDYDIKPLESYNTPGETAKAVSNDAEVACE
jgi:hypothetical protein